MFVLIYTQHIVIPIYNLLKIAKSLFSYFTHDVI